MVEQYSAELRASWVRGTSPRNIRRLKYALGGARECLALLRKGPPTGGRAS